jgi:AraC-like DNA-binding protein
MALTHKDFTLKNQQKHLLPFLFGLAWYFIYLHPSEKYFRNIVIIVVFGYYLRSSYRCITQYKIEAYQYYSESIHLRLTWLKTLLGLASLFLGLAVADLASGPHIPLWQFRPFLTTFSLFVLTFFALRQSKVFGVVETQQPKTPRLSDEELNRYRVKLLEYMEKESPYLNPELRLTDLSEALGLKSYQLSEVLNRAMRTNFFQFINRYRIEVAKERLRDPQYNYMNIIGIAMDSGFNSKSSFNETFRDFVGQTPSIYRSKQK